MKHLEDYRRIHKENAAYGSGPSAEDLAILRRQCERGPQPRRVIDYGCGNSRAAEQLWPDAERVLYDPAIPGKDRLPRGGPYDIGLCTDVLEHVPADELHATLRRLRELTPGWVFLIHTGPARQQLPSGGNAHVTQKPRDWWRWRLAHYFSPAPADTLTDFDSSLPSRIGFCTLKPQP